MSKLTEQCAEAKKLRAQCKQAKKLRQSQEETESELTKAFRKRRHNASAQRKRDKLRAERLKHLPDETITALMATNMQELIKTKDKIDYHATSDHKNAEKFMEAAQRRYTRIVGIVTALKNSRHKETP